MDVLALTGIGLVNVIFTTSNNQISTFTHITDLSIKVLKLWHSTSRHQLYQRIPRDEELA